MLLQRSCSSVTTDSSSITTDSNIITVSNNTVTVISDTDIIISVNNYTATNTDNNAAAADQLNHVSWISR